MPSTGSEKPATPTTSADDTPTWFRAADDDTPTWPRASDGDFAWFDPERRAS
ncbi:MAG: hypothetical protein ABWY11_26210 [Umezawaea sp.]